MNLQTEMEHAFKNGHDLFTMITVYFIYFLVNKVFRKLKKNLDITDAELQLNNWIFMET